MKKTIREDRETIVLDEVILNDNSLLRYCIEGSNNAQYISVSVRYIEMSAIMENNICKLDIESKLNPIINISDDRTVMAIFKQDDGEQILQSIYDLNKHLFISDGEMNFVYNKKFHNGDNRQFKLEK